MPVLDWTVSRRRKGTGGSTKVYKVDVISMTEDDTFAEVPTRPDHGTLRKIKSLNDLLEEGAESDNESTKSDFEQSELQQEPEVEEKETNSSKDWTNYLTQRSKKPVERMVVSGFSTLSRRAGGGSYTPIIYIKPNACTEKCVCLRISCSFPACDISWISSHAHTHTHVYVCMWVVGEVVSV